MQVEWKKIEEEVQKVLTKHRFEHTIGVTYTCASLAMCYHYDVTTARVAGLLHDCAKNMSDEELLRECKKANIKINEVEKVSPYLLHGKLGAFYAKEKYGVDSQEIQSAIAYHTTGKENMSVLEMIVFVADYIEPNRKELPRITEIRYAAFQNLEHATSMILENVYQFLKETKDESAIDPMTKKAYEFYKGK